MSDDAQPPGKSGPSTSGAAKPAGAVPDKTADEAFFARWSRRKQLTKPAATRPPSSLAVATAPAEAVPGAEAVSPSSANKDNASAPTTAHDTEAARGAANTTPKPLTEADFDDVDFDALNYGSDYGRFMQTGVPEGIRQKALAKLWQSDAMFTSVDPFQDYAGDYTDAAVVPKSGIVKTAYKIGQGFLSDDEAHAWHRLDKPPLAVDMAALAVLVPGVRIRPATAADGPALLAVHTSAILETAAAHLGPELAASWADGLTAETYERSMADGQVIEIAIDEETGAAVAFAGIAGNTVERLYVHPRRTRRGLGQALLRRALLAIRNAGHGTAKLDAAANARGFFEAQGFRAVKTRQAQSRGGAAMDVFDMEKLLAAPSDLSFSRETPDQPEIRAFFAASEAYMAALYPAESNHFVDAAVLAQPDVVFLVARGAGQALGCGAIVKAADGSAEIKRMWISPDARGLKLGQRLLDALIDVARTEGVSKLQLETGVSQPEALGLYRRSGFVEVGPFGDYRPDPLSVFMERTIALV